MKNLYLSILSILMAVPTVWGQQSGNVNFEQLGISFDIPEGWVGQEANGVYVIASYTKAGVIILSPQDYSGLDVMKAELAKGYKEDGGTSLMPSSAISELDANTVTMECSGTLQWQAAKGFVTATMNQFGQDVVIMAITTANLYTEEYKNLVLGLERSLTFAKPKVAPASNDWKSLLSGVKLTYMDSYYSSSYTDGGVSGGYSTKMVFDLCSQGYFIHYGSDNMTVGSDVSSGYSSGNSQGSGRWEVIGNTLKLTFNNGRVWEYQLSMKEGKTYLDGKKYFRTWTGDYAPNCR